MALKLLTAFCFLLTFFTVYVTPGHIFSTSCGGGLGSFATLAFERCNGTEACHLSCTGTSPTKCQGTRELVITFYPVGYIEGGRTTLELGDGENVFYTILNVYTCDYIDCPMYNTEKHYRVKMSYDFMVSSPRNYTATLKIVGADETLHICRNFETILGQQVEMANV